MMEYLFCRGPWARYKPSEARCTVGCPALMILSFSLGCQASAVLLLMSIACQEEALGIVRNVAARLGESSEAWE